MADLFYEGLPVAREVALREEEGGCAFAPLAAPMPVGTRLEVRDGDQSRRARVEHVDEGAQAGMRLRFLSGEAAAGKPEPER